MAARMIDDKQKKIIWASARENDIDKETLYSVIDSVAGKEHMTELTYAEAAKVIDRIRYGKKHTSRPGSKISDKQLKMIRGLVATLGWDNKRLSGFVKRYKVDNINWLSKYQASDCIEALKSMIKRKCV